MFVYLALCFIVQLYRSVILRLSKKGSFITSVCLFLIKVYLWRGHQGALATDLIVSWLIWMFRSFCSIISRTRSCLLYFSIYTLLNGAHCIFNFYCKTYFYLRSLLFIAISFHFWSFLLTFYCNVKKFFLPYLHVHEKHWYR